MGRRVSSKRRRLETPVILSNTQLSLSCLVSNFSVDLWSDLPLDIGNLILDKLPEVVEHIRFGAVCKGWYIILKQYVKRNVLPMLLVRLLDAPMLLSLSCLGKHYSKLQLWLPSHHRRYIGTSHGWVAVQNWDYTFTFVYPFGRKITIPLPPIRGQDSNYNMDVKKFVISPNATLTDYTVVAIYRQMSEFVTIKAGEKYWVFISTRSLTNPIGSLFKDIIFHQGSVYLVDHICKIIKVDVQARPPVIKAVHHLFRKYEMHGSYLVESTSLDLYLLQRFYHCTCNHHQSRTSRFNMFKLKVHGEKENGEQFITKTKSKSLKGDTFFIGDNNESMAIKSTGCIPNSIYFVDQNCCLPYPKCRYVVANYSTGDGNIRNIYKTNVVDREGLCQPPIWIVPQLHFAHSEKLLTF